MSRRPGKESLSREQVIAAACVLAEERGLAQLNLKDLAQALGIKPPSLYNHIASLDELREEIAIVAVDRLNEALERAILGRSGEKALRELMKAYRTFAQKNQELYGATQRVARGSDRLKERAGAIVVTISFLFEGLKKEERIHRIRTIRSLLHGFIELERIEGFGLPERVDQTFERIMALALTLLPGNETKAKGRVSRGVH